MATLTMMVSKLLKVMVAVFYVQAIPGTLYNQLHFQVIVSGKFDIFLLKMCVVIFLRTRRRGGKSPEDDGQSGGCYGMHLWYWQDLRAGGSCE